MQYIKDPIKNAVIDLSIKEFKKLFSKNKNKKVQNNFSLLLTNFTK